MPRHTYQRQRLAFNALIALLGCALVVVLALTYRMETARAVNYLDISSTLAEKQLEQQLREADTVLANFGFGRAHHRAIYFIARNPGISVSDLLGILKITKQSLSRVLNQLIKEDYVRHQTDRVDRRRRLLELSQKGEDLERQLTARQCSRIIGAFEAAGVDSISGFRSILRGMIDPGDQGRVDQRANYFSKDDKRRLAG